MTTCTSAHPFRIVTASLTIRFTHPIKGGAVRSRLLLCLSFLALMATGAGSIGGGDAWSGGPFDATNADKVDGRHAVPASATVAGRRGKLVATDTTGRLPNNIIAKAPDADRVDGRHANALIRVARMGTTATLELSTADQTYGNALSIGAPAAGFVTIHGGTTINNTGCTTTCAAVGAVRHVQSGTFSFPAFESIAPGQSYANLSHAWVFPVEAGVNTFDIRLSRHAGDGNLYGWYGELTALYTPFGPGGTGTLPPATAATATKSLDAN